MSATMAIVILVDEAQTRVRVDGHDTASNHALVPGSDVHYVRGDRLGLVERALGVKP